MIRRSLALVIVVGLSLAALAAPAESVTAARPESAESGGLTGDWGGWRTDLASLGLDPFASYTTGFWSNLAGGRDRGVRYLGFAQWGLEADLEALIGWRGGGLHVDWISYHGGQPSERLVGSFPLQNASGLEAEQSIRFFEIYLEQVAFGDRLRLKIGQLALDQEFMLAEHASRFRNAAFGDFVTSGTAGAVAVYPVTAPGAYLEAEPLRDWRLRIGAYSGDPGDDERDNYGFDASFSRDRGATIFGEIALEKAPFDLPGTYLVGLGTQTGNLANFNRGRSSDGSQIFYASIDQTLHRAQRSAEGGGLDVGVFLRAGVPLRADRVSFAWQMNGGIEATGIVPGRPADSVGFGFAYLDFANDYLRRVRRAGGRVKSREAVLELTYRAEVTSWLWIQPDLQYFVDPHLGGRNALVFGWVVEIEL